MQIITDKKELINIIGDWTTAHVYTDYKLGSNEIYLKYGNNEIVFQSDNVASVAYIALQCHAITNNQYGQVLFN